MLVQPDFRIAGGGILHVARILPAEITLGIDVGMQQGAVAAGQADQGLIDRLVAVRD